jgi:predicted metalloprotease with PDZ domain
MKSRPRLAPPVRVLALLVLLLAPCAAQESQPTAARPYRIGYRLSMPQPESHLFDVQVDVREIGGDGHVDFQMPRWSPGRYAVFDFAKNVQEVKAASACPPAAAGCERRALPVARLDTQTWRVGAPGPEGVTLSYKVFADDLSGTFSQLDRRHANYNGHSVFMYVAGHKQDPVELKIVAPPRWRIVNGQTAREGQDEFRFPNYDLLADTPTEIAPDWTVEEFVVGGKTYRVVVHSFGDEGGRRGELARQVERVVRAQVEMMGEPEFERYVFLFHFDPTAPRGDGMEHLNSTQIVETGPLADGEVFAGAVDTASHEFFHVWNVKRLRPQGLGPWDFTRPVVTRGLWIAEGFTNYYGRLHMYRAGLRDEAGLYERFAGNITGVENSPGSRLMSAEESSLVAPFLDRAGHDQRTNLENTAVSYYPKGEALGLALDLLIRGRTRGRSSLDEVMRRAYRKFYLESPNDSYYLRGRGYTPEEFFALASEVTGLDLGFFLEQHVRRPAPPPYEEAFAYVGLRFARAPEPGSAAAGLTFDEREAKRAVVAAVRPGSSAERAGLRPGDVLVSVGRKDVNAKNWRDALDALKAGEPAPLTYRRAGLKADTLITLHPGTIYRIEKDDRAAPEARALRDAWLKGR